MGTHFSSDSGGGHRMLSIIKQCKRITSNRSISTLLILSIILVIASTLTEAMQLKRAGFVGMRGKKSIEGSVEDLYETDPESEADLYDGPEAAYPYNYFKRAGFVGMRGKKSQSDYSRYLRRPTLFDALQRHVRAGFVGMRG